MCHLSHSQARLIVRTARFLAAMSGIIVLGAIMFNIGHMLRSVLLAELGSLVGQLAVGWGLVAINSFFHKSIAHAVNAAKAQSTGQGRPVVLLTGSDNDHVTVREGTGSESSEFDTGAVVGTMPADLAHPRLNSHEV